MRAILGRTDSVGPGVELDLVHVNKRLVARASGRFAILPPDSAQLKTHANIVCLQQPGYRTRRVSDVHVRDPVDPPLCARSITVQFVDVAFPDRHTPPVSTNFSRQ